MSSNKLPLYVLQELPNVTESISNPLKSSQRIKYTCFNVSKSLIAFGATSGGIYVFNRDPCEFVQLIPSKDGAVTRLAISPDDRHIAFANGRGKVTVTQCDQSHNKTVSSKEHQGNEVTALQWNGTNMVISGDDVGKISVLQLPGFITKTMFQSSSQTIMSLESRICQLDVKDNMLLVSTLTRCYICDTLREQYRQIGQKLRDGEYGACFVTTEKLENGTVEENNQDMIEVKKFHIVDGDEAFAVNEKLANTAIFSSRPSSRLWEASIDGTVKRTHQFKQVLARKPMQVISKESYDKENVCLEKFDNGTEGQSCNFSKVFSINKSAIFSFKKDALYFLDIQDVDNTMWFDTYRDIVDCKLFNDVLYVWLQNGSLVCLRFMRIDKYLVKCFLDEKFTVCSELCALFSDYFVSSNNLSTKLYILAGLREKIVNNEALERIEDVLKRFDSLKANDSTQMKSGIYVVDNSYQTQSMLDDADEGTNVQDIKSKQLPTLKDLSLTMTDKLNVSKKMFKEKWEGFEEKMKYLGGDKTQVLETNLPTPVKLCDRSVEDESIAEQKVQDDDIVYKESSQKSIELNGDTLETDNLILERDKLCKSLYQHYRLSLVGKETDETNLLTLIENYACDIKVIYKLMLYLSEYCVKIGAIEESKHAPNTIFLNYLNETPKRDSNLDEIIDDEVLYKYFVDSCISVNMKTHNPNLACECGFPLPYLRTNQTPICSAIIDQFIEKQWSSQTKEQCYDICKRMPYLWRKILYLRRNEDLLNILRLLLQILDESILHLFLPQFTIETWDRATQLYAILHANMCLNCNKSFDHMSVKHTLSWDDIGSLMIKSIGGTRAIKLIEKHAQLIGVGELSVKFYHTCILASLFEKFDATSVGPLTDTIYSCYEFEDSRNEICNLLRSSIKGHLKNTSLPIIVAAKSNHWGASNIFHSITSKNTREPRKNVTINEVLVDLSAYDGNTDCSLCGLPLVNEVLIQDGGLWVFKCGHVFHGACLDLNKLRLCPTCVNV